MLITIEEFRRRVACDSEGLVLRLQEETGRYGVRKRTAWESSIHEAESHVPSTVVSAVALVLWQPRQPSTRISDACRLIMGRRGPAGTTTNQHRQP